MGDQAVLEGIVIQIMKQVGELAKHVMTMEHYYFAGRERLPGYATDSDKIGDEPADVFSMVIRPADHYGIGLVQAHVRARQAEDAHLTRAGL